MARLTTLGVVQFLAAVHIFSYQIYNARHGFFQHTSFQHWAASWYSFMFALEGFRLTYSQLKGPSPEDMGPILPYLLEHTVRLYPVYFVSVALLLGVSSVAVSLNMAHVNAVPIFTWIGTTADGWHRAWNGGAWHISDLSFHLVCWRFVYPKLMSLPDGTCWCVLGAALGFTYLRITAHALGFATKLAMWAPYTFNHFLCGMCLAKLFVSRGIGRSGAPRDSLLLEVWPHRFAFSGVLVLMAVSAIIFDGPHPNGIHYFAPYALWLGAMMPLHLLLIWTLALEEGPLAELCRRRPFVWLGDAAYAMFVLHWNAVVSTAKFVSIMELWPITGRTKFTAVILPGVCALVLLVHFLVERPLQHWTRRQRDFLCPKDE